MKKLLSLVLSVFLALSFTMVSCAGNEDENGDGAKHTHEFVQGQTVAATCSQQGYTVYTCSCGETKKDNYTAKRAHNYTQKKVSATCIAQGYTLHTCTQCQDSYKSDYVTTLAKHKGTGVCTECNKDLHAAIADRIKAKGVWDNSGYYRYTTSNSSTSNTYTYHLLFDPTDNDIQLFIFTGAYSFGISFAKAKTSYTWLIEYASYQMSGSVSASTWTEYSTIRYTASNLPSSLNTSTAKLATSFLNLGLSYINLFLVGTQMDVVNLGFILYE